MYGLRNRQASEREISDLKRDKKERELFEQEDWSSLDAKKLSRHNLKAALIRMRNLHIRKSIPLLMAEIQTQFRECEARLHTLGQARTTNQAQFMFVNDVSSEYFKKIRNGLEGNYNNLQGSNMFIRTRIVNIIEEFRHGLNASGPKMHFRTAGDDAAVLAGKDQTT